MRFEASAGLLIGPFNQGTLVANGTAAAPIVFTSSSGATNGWKGLVFDRASAYPSGRTQLSYCVIEKAGVANAYGAERGSVLPGHALLRGDRTRSSRTA